MKKVLLYIFLCVSVLTSCDRSKPYTISGSFDIPMELNMGDTIIQREKFEGLSVYLLDLDGEKIDSTIVDENEKFCFEGNVSEKNAFFSVIDLGFAQEIFAIEPGEITMTITEEGILTYGTAINDGINDVNSQIDELAEDFNNKLTAMETDETGTPSDSLLMPVWTDFNDKCNTLLNTLYEQNSENLLGVYIVNMMTSSAQSSAEFDQILEEYSDYVKDSPMITVHRNYLQQLEARQEYMEMMRDSQLSEEEQDSDVVEVE